MIKRISITLLFCVTLSSLFAGGGWPQPKGKGYFKLSQNFIISPFYYSPSGEIIDITTIGLFTTSLYAEYGFTSRLTGILYFPFFVRGTLNEVQTIQPNGNIVSNDPGDSFQSIGDTDIALKYGLVTNKPIVVSATILFGLPLGETAGGNSQILQSGDGEFNQMIRIDASHSFHPKPVYVSAYAAFNNRTGGFSDEVRFGAEVGITLKKFIPILKLNVVQSLFNGESKVLIPTQNGIFSNNTEYLSPTFELNYQATEKIGVSGSVGGAFAARNILAAPNWSLGVYLKL
jgi:protein XagA